MKMKIVTLLLIVSVSFNVGILFFFSNHWAMKKGFSGRRSSREYHWLKDRMRKELALTDDQARYIEKGRREFEADILPIKKELQQKRKELFTLAAGESIDDVKMDQLIQDITRLQITMERSVIIHMREVKKSLTPEQQEKFRETIERGFMKMPFDRRDTGADVGKSGR